MSYDVSPDRLRELLDRLAAPATGRTLAQLQDDAELNALDILDRPDRAMMAGVAVRRIVAEAWQGGRAEGRAEHAVPEGSWQKRLDYLKACIQGLNLLQGDAEGLSTSTYAEAVARGQQRIIAACRALADAAGEQVP